MMQIEDRCCGCATEAFHCLGSSCPNRNTEIYYCDKCGDEIEGVYEVDGEDLCEACLKEMFKKEI